MFSVIPLTITPSIASDGVNVQADAVNAKYCAIAEAFNTSGLTSGGQDLYNWARSQGYTMLQTGPRMLPMRGALQRGSVVTMKRVTLCWVSQTSMVLHWLCLFSKDVLIRP